jgi:hypothetical protein
MLITPAEAAALLERPTRGRKVHTSTILRWGKQGKYQLAWCNGWKVDRASFVTWATATHRLKSAPRYTGKAPRKRACNSSSIIILKNLLGV